MGIFGQSTPFDIDVEKATSEKNTSEPWGVIMDICDKVGSNPRHVKDCLKSIMKRMAHTDPHVVIQAITLLDACVNNCGKNFHLEIASREFENEFKRIMAKTQPQVALKMRLLLKKWAENDFKADPQLNLIPSLYHKLKSEGYEFSESNPKTTKTTPSAALKDPNVVTSQQEEEDIAKAIELSLKEAKNSPKKQQTSSATASSTSSTYPSLYPSFSAGAASLDAMNSSLSSNQEARKVRALYDFEAAEDNELTFTAGDIIHVLDDSDPNWWKGYNQNGEGLFPSNFVTADLSVEPERLDINQKTKKSIKFEDEVNNGEKTDVNNKFGDEKSYVPEINEEKIDRLLHLLHEANPEDPTQDSEEMLRLEEQVNKMGPLIDTELERVDRKHAQLTQLSSDLVDAVNLYHTLMREPDRTNMSVMSGMYYHGFNASQPQGLYGAAGGIYPMQNMYHTPTSMPNMPMIHSSLPGQAQPNLQSQSQMTSLPPQISVQGNTSQMIPMQYQNGHPPHSGQFPNQQQQLSGQTYQSQAPHTLQSIQNTITSTNQQPVTTSQQQQLQQNSQPSTNQHIQQGSQQQQQLPSNSQINTNFIPPNSSMPPGMYPPPQGINVMPNMPGMMPPPVFQPLQMSQHHPIISNGLMGGQIVNNVQPQSLPSLNSSLQSQFSVINQPVTHTILGQSDSKTIIPIHQQQR